MGSCSILIHGWLVNNIGSLTLYIYDVSLQFFFYYNRRSSIDKNTKFDGEDYLHFWPSTTYSMILELTNILEDWKIQIKNLILCDQLLGERKSRYLI